MQQLEMNKRLKGFVGTVILFVFLGINLWAQNAESTIIFAELSPKMRSQLNSRLNLLIKFQREKDWIKMYDLLSKDFLKDESRKDFVNRMKKEDETISATSFINFTPESEFFLNTIQGKEKLIVFGCLEIEETNKKLGYKGSVNVNFQKNKWYFSSLIVFNPISGFGQMTLCNPVEDRNQ